MASQPTPPNVTSPETRPYSGLIDHWPYEAPIYDRGMLGGLA